MALVFDPEGIGFYDTGTGGLQPPIGTTKERPVNPRPGFMRYNSDLAALEIYGNNANTANGNTWGTFVTGDYTAQVMLIGGGGSGSGGGGGAGGLLYTNSMLLVGGQRYMITIGAGGTSGGRGVDTTFNGLVALAGGGAAQIGGSGGGNSWGGQHQWGSPVVGTYGQGNPGGVGYYHSDWGHSYGGGGGAGASGAWGASSPGGQSGAGGSGASYSIAGASTYYAGGGGGGQGGRSWYGGGGAGGGGGGNAQQGQDFTGGGGCNNNGGSGLCIISYFGRQRATGGMVTFNGSSTVHTFYYTDYFIA
jgi:hypothetical protein